METKQIETDINKTVESAKTEPYTDDDYKTNILIHREKLLSTRQFDNYYRKLIKTDSNSINSK